MDEFDVNPFADPSISQVRPSQPHLESIDDFNPFADIPTSNSFNTMPAVVQATPVEASSYNVHQLKATTDDLRRQQDELDRRAAELERREQELRRNLDTTVRINNFPPLPSWFCVKPCFHQDINIDIPIEFQKLVKYHFYLWIAYSSILLINVIGSICLMAINAEDAGSTFGLSILFFILFTPCSFVCWFRPIYNAFKNDSSFNFFLYFFVFFMQFCVSIIQCLGIKASGTVGFISGFSTIGSNIGIGFVLVVVGFLFASVAAVAIYLLFKVHKIYRLSGASFAKAQEEFAKGVFSNPTVRQTAASVATSAARISVEQNFGKQ